MFKGRKFKRVYFIIILTSLISYKIIDDLWITPHAVDRYTHQMSILKGESFFPHQYRVLQPAMGYVLQKVLYIAVHNTYRANLYAYKILGIFTFLLMYSCFYYFLKMFFSDQACMTGLLLLQAVFPLSLTGRWGEGDFYTFIFYTIGLILMFKSKDYFLPLVFLIGSFNRDQIIFLLVFYVIYLISRKSLFTRKTYIVIALSLMSYAIGYFTLRWKFGYLYDNIVIFAGNIVGFWYIIQIWIAEVFVFVILSLKSFKNSSQFFKLGLISLIAYTIFFFFYGSMGELAKFLPAYLILIPMTLETLTGESTDIKEASFTHNS